MGSYWEKPGIANQSSLVQCKGINICRFLIIPQLLPICLLPLLVLQMAFQCKYLRFHISWHFISFQKCWPTTCLKHLFPSKMPHCSSSLLTSLSFSEVKCWHFVRSPLFSHPILTDWVISSIIAASVTTYMEITDRMISFMFVSWLNLSLVWPTLSLTSATRFPQDRKQSCIRWKLKYFHEFTYLPLARVVLVK